MIPKGNVTEEMMRKPVTPARPIPRGRVSESEAVGCGPARSKSVFLALVKALMTAATLVRLCVGDVALAAKGDVSLADLEGRWKNPAGDLVLDISRCGSGWCGVDVDRESVCGRIALRLEERSPSDVNLTGRLELADRAQPYSVWASLYRDEKGIHLQMHGQSGDRVELWRRTFPFMATLARIGDVQCRPDAKVS